LTLSFFLRVFAFLDNPSKSSTILITK